MGVAEHLTCVFLRVENKRASRWQARFSQDTIWDRTSCLRQSVHAGGRSVSPWVWAPPSSEARSWFWILKRGHAAAGGKQQWSFLGWGQGGQRGPRESWSKPLP